MVHKHRGILNNRNAIFSLCETRYEAQFRPDVTSFFVGWCIYENFRSLLPRPWPWQSWAVFLLIYHQNYRLSDNKNEKVSERLLFLSQTIFGLILSFRCLLSHRHYPSGVTKLRSPVPLGYTAWPGPWYQSNAQFEDLEMPLVYYPKTLKKIFFLKKTKSKSNQNLRTFEFALIRPAFLFV